MDKYGYYGVRFTISVFVPAILVRAGPLDKSHALPVNRVLFSVLRILARVLLIHTLLVLTQDAHVFHIFSCATPEAESTQSSSFFHDAACPRALARYLEALQYYVGVTILVILARIVPLSERRISFPYCTLSVWGGPSRIVVLTPPESGTYSISGKVVRRVE